MGCGGGGGFTAARRQSGAGHGRPDVARDVGSGSDGTSEGMASQRRAEKKARRGGEIARLITRGGR